MTREEHLQFCTICVHRKPNLQKGLLCGLTGNLADFEGNCASFKEEAGKKERELWLAMSNAGNLAEISSINYKRNLEWGLLLLCAAILLFLITFLYSGELGYWVAPAGLAFWGFRLYRKGEEQKQLYHKYLETKEKLEEQKNATGSEHASNP